MIPQRSQGIAIPRARADMTLRKFDMLLSGSGREPDNVIRYSGSIPSS